MIKSWRYKNLTLLFCSLIFSVFLGSYPPFQSFLFSHGLPTAFIAGLLFISTFTCPIACAMLLVLAEKYPLPELWSIAAIAAIMSDYIFFNMIKDNIGEELKPIFEGLTGGNHIKNVLGTEHFRWLFPIIGAGIILSPLPKVMGLNMLGIHKLKRMQFIALSAGVNTVGIAFILLLSFFIKP